jgi:hypothetical protein
MRYNPSGIAAEGKITLQYVLINPKNETIIYWGINVTSYANKSEITTILKKKPFPKNLCLANGYAAKDAKITCTAVLITLTNTLLNKYLQNGTHRLDVKLNNNVKFSSVGLITKNRGGKMNISSKGFKACITVYTKGKTIIIPSKHRKNKIVAFPLKVLFSFFVPVLAMEKRLQKTSNRHSL